MRNHAQQWYVNIPPAGKTSAFHASKARLRRHIMRSGDRPSNRLDARSRRDCPAVSVADAFDAALAKDCLIIDREFQTNSNQSRKRHL